MKTSNTGYELIKKHEGYSDKSYWDKFGRIWTIGYGHTKGVKAGMNCTQLQAEQWLHEDCLVAEKAVNKYVKVYNFNQNQYDALVSFALNIGSIDTLTSKGTRSIDLIAKKMLEYNKAGGVKLDGLVKRRFDEASLFKKGCVEPVTVKMSATDIAVKVIRGQLGNGKEREKNIIALGGDPKEVQKIVNSMM